MSSVIPQAADIISIPVWNSEQEKGKLTIEWKQTFSKSGDYYTIVAKNTTQGGGLTIMFIQAEWYNDSGKSNGQHISHLGEVKDGHVNVTLDGRFQYGQQNATGNMRFIVYHDQGRKIYQHRFKATSKAMMIGGVVEGIAKQWDEVMTAAAFKLLTGYIGDYLHKF